MYIAMVLTTYNLLFVQEGEFSQSQQLDKRNYINKRKKWRAHLPLPSFILKLDSLNDKCNEYLHIILEPA